MQASTMTKETNRVVLEVVQFLEGNMQSGTVENSTELRQQTGAGMWKGIDYALFAFKVVTWLDPANRMVGDSLMDAVGGITAGYKGRTANAEDRHTKAKIEDSTRETSSQQFPGAAILNA